MAYSLAHCLGAYDSTLDDFFNLQADEVLSLLPPSKRKTHLKVRMEALFSDEHLLSEAKAETGSWNPSELTQEDKFLLEELALTPCEVHSHSSNPWEY